MREQTSNQAISYYDVLQINAAASDDDVKLAYHSLAKKFHPDRNPMDRRMAELRFRLINEAYAHLKTREKRERYNRVLRAQGKNQKTTLQAQNDNGASDMGRGFFSTLAQIFWPAPAKGTEGR